jgi:hypothetical protein
MKDNQITSYDILVLEAIAEHKAGNVDKLVKLFSEGFPLHSNKHAHKYILRLIGKQKPLGGQRKDHSEMLQLIAVFYGASIPLYTDEPNKTPNICNVLSESFNITPKAIYKIWAKERSSCQLKELINEGKKNTLIYKNIFRIYQDQSSYRLT